MPLISNKTLNLSVIIVTFSVNLSDFSRSLKMVALIYFIVSEINILIKFR